MPSNFSTSGIDIDNVFLQRSYTILDDVNVPGGLWAWGQNYVGPLGLGDIIHRSSPVQVGSLTNWKWTANGRNHFAGIKTDGSLWVSGDNTYGQLGLGDRVQRSSPVQVGSLTNWKKLACGSDHTLAIKTDGSLWAWGVVGYGQLGLGDRVNRSSPVQVGSLTNWKQVASLSTTCLAVKTDGTLWAWGSGGSGQLGIGYQVIGVSSPVQVGSLTNWKQVATSTGSHSVAVKTDGSLWAFGRNFEGQLGLNTITLYSSPVQVGSLTNWKSAAGGSNYSAAVKTDGTLWAWGKNDLGELGLGDIIHRSSPVQVGSLTNWKQVFTTGGSYSLAVKTDGTLWAWGTNSKGQLGLGDTSSRSSPVQVGSLTNWKLAAGGSDNSTAIRSLI